MRFPKTTDLTEIKKVAVLFLNVDIKKHDGGELYPIFCLHPFTNTAIVFINGYHDGVPFNLDEDCEGMSLWRQKTLKLIDGCEDVFSLMFLITDNYKLAFFKEILPYLSKADMSQMLGSVWTDLEHPNNNGVITQRKMLSLFRNSDPESLMDEGERETFRKLPATVKVYRGVTEYNKKNVNVLSWTTSKQTATWFAERFRGQGTVYTATIPREHILACFNGRNEHEVIVDPAFLEIQNSAPVGKNAASRKRDDT